MRTYLRISLALLIALALSTSASAQTTAGTAHDRFSLNAAVGPSFASLGTTFAATTGLEFNLTDRAAIVGEFGMLPRATFDNAAEIAPPLVGTDARRVNAYHWQGNVKVRPFDLGNASPYLTAASARSRPTRLPIRGRLMASPSRTVAERLTSRRTWAPGFCIASTTGWA